MGKIYEMDNSCNVNDYNNFGVFEDIKLFFGINKEFCLRVK